MGGSSAILAQTLFKVVQSYSVQSCSLQNHSLQSFSLQSSSVQSFSMLVNTVQSCFLQRLHKMNFSVLGIFALQINTWSYRTMFSENLQWHCRIFLIGSWMQNLPSATKVHPCHHQSNITSSNSFVAYSDHVWWPARTCKVYELRYRRSISHSEPQIILSSHVSLHTHSTSPSFIYISNICEAMSLLKCQTSFEFSSDLHPVSPVWCLSLELFNPPSQWV